MSALHAQEYCHAICRQSNWSDDSRAPLAPGPGSATVLIGGMPAWRAMIDQHACPAVSISGADGVGSVQMGSATVFINAQMVCRMGDIVVEVPGAALGPVNPILMGCPTVIIGG